MNADPFVCPSCGWTGSHRRCVWVYRAGQGNSSFACPECYTQSWRTDMEDAWPSMPDVEGKDMFEQYPVMGEENE